MNKCVVALIIIKKLSTKKIKLYLSLRYFFLFLNDSIINDIRIKKEDIEIADGIRITPILKNLLLIFSLVIN